MARQYTGRKPDENMMDEQTKIIVGNRLRMVRESLGFSQNAFAKTIEMSQATVNTSEAGFAGHERKQPSRSYIYRVCKVHGANPDWILTGEGEMFLRQNDTEIELVTKAMHGQSDIKKRMILTVASMPDELIEKIVLYWENSKA